MKKTTDISWPPALKSRMEALVKWLKRKGSAVLAYSGGVDSTFLAAVAHEALGERVLAVTASSPTYPRQELDEAVVLAGKIGIRHKIVQSTEMGNALYRENPPDRCYHCKSELFGLLTRMASEGKMAGVIDGSNADDVNDYRPGRKALKELGIASPLMELGFSKADIREASRLMGLPTSDKPAYACLASRIPYGTPITEKALRSIEEAEDALRDLGFEQVRVRMHGDVARIELAEGEIGRAVSGEMRRKMTSVVKASGFRYATLDLQGYRTGSMNEALSDKS